MCLTALVLGLAAAGYGAAAEIRYRRQRAAWRERQWTGTLRAHRDHTMGRIRDYSRPGYQWRTNPKETP